MLRVGPYLFKQAESDQEFDQIHQLNYRTFVREIGQYSDPGTGRLVDKFHHKNVYFIGLKHGRVVGMLSAHDQPPFSISDRLEDPKLLEKPGMNVMEVRLLAVEPDERHSSLFFGLIYTIYHYAMEKGKTHLVISGVSNRLRMYQRLGFVPLGPAVQSGQAMFIPMILDFNRIPRKLFRIKELWEAHIENQESAEPAAAKPSALRRPGEPDALAQAIALDGAEICLLPGPVTVSASVRRAFSQPPLYHRNPAFIERFASVRQQLSRMVRGADVAILNGSGTLANETIAANLASIDWDGRGLLLVNGEFGERLERQVGRFGLQPRVLRWPWGKPWDLDEVESALQQEPAGWIWGVHQESSTGVLNDLDGLIRIAQRHGAEVCADCISSLGAVDIDLSHVLMASGTSGKSLGSYAGAAIVFADRRVLDMVDRSQVPSYFDLVAAMTKDGPCYTFPSPILLALEAALAPYETEDGAQEVYRRYAELGVYVRNRLREIGLTPLADEEWASPVVTTFAPPDGMSSMEFVDKCLASGVAIGGQSGYLAQRGLVQIATMGAVTRRMCDTFFERLVQSHPGPGLVAAGCASVT